MTGARLLVRTLACGIAVVLLSACGVPQQTTAEPLPPNALPSPLRVPVPSPSSSPSPSPSTVSPPSTPSAQPTVSRLRLWFVQEDGLAAAESDLPTGTTPDLVVQSLAIGPTPLQSAEGLRTVARDPLTGLALVSVAPTLPSPSSSMGVPSTGPASGPPVSPTSALPASVTVRLSAAFTALPPVEQVLLLGQVVLSLTGADQQSVAFVDEAGVPLAVPLPDGRLLDVPATARDYASLIVRP